MSGSTAKVGLYCVMSTNIKEPISFNVPYGLNLPSSFTLRHETCSYRLINTYRLWKCHYFTTWDFSLLYLSFEGMLWKIETLEYNGFRRYGVKELCVSFWFILIDGFFINTLKSLYCVIDWILPKLFIVDKDNYVRVCHRYLMNAQSIGVFIYVDEIWVFLNKIFHFFV